MPDYFPALLDLRGRRCLVVGGGDVAERKVKALVDCGARAIVVSPTATPGIVALAESGLVMHCRRPFRKSDARRCAVVIAATGHADIDAAVARAARHRRALVNVVDRPQECDFIVPSVLRRGQLQIAVSTGGRSPALAREIRRRLEPLFGPEHAELVERVARARASARAAAMTPAARLDAGERVVAAAIAGIGVNGRHAATRNGGITTVSMSTMSLANPVRHLDGDEPAELLAAVIPDLTERLIAAHPGRVYREAARLLERALLQYVLDASRGNQLQAARMLGVNRNTLRKRCRQLALEIRRGRRDATPTAGRV